MNILTIKGGIVYRGHNASATLMKNGNIVTSVEEERLVREKYIGDLPMNAIEFCLKKGNISLSDIDFLGIVGLDKERKEKHSDVLFSYSNKKNVYPSPWYHTKNKLKELQSIFRSLKDACIVENLPHQLMHAASSYYNSSFSDAAVLVCEGSGDFETSGLYSGLNGTIEKVHDFLVVPHSLGVLYSMVSDHIGLSGLGGPGKTMGLAAFGTADPDMFNGIVQITDDILHPVEIFPYYPTSIPTQYFEKFGSRRLVHQPLEQRHYDIAASLQFITEQAILAFVRSARALLPERSKLCVAGGIMINVNANRKILESGLYGDVFFVPAANDGGLSLGAALYLHKKYAPHAAIPKFNVYLGPDVENDFDVDAALQDYALFIDVEDCLHVEEHAADALNRGEIIGWMQGKMEWGPRALGNRSILANPLLPDIKKRLDSQVKVREPFRPYAASVLAEEADTCFTPPFSPYMLLSSDVLPEAAVKTPGIVHADGSCRPQAVTREANAVYYDLLAAFFKKTGCPYVLNTSFNLHGEPIVNSPEDALDDLLFSGLDAVYIGKRRITAKKQELFVDLSLSKMPKDRKRRMLLLRTFRLVKKKIEEYGFCVLRMHYTDDTYFTCEDSSLLSQGSWMLWGNGDESHSIYFMLADFRKTYRGIVLAPEERPSQRELAEYSFSDIKQLKPEFLVIPGSCIWNFWQRKANLKNRDTIDRIRQNIFSIKDKPSIKEFLIFHDSFPGNTSLLSTMERTECDREYQVPVYPLDIASNARFAIWTLDTNAEFFKVILPTVHTLGRGLSVTRVISRNPAQHGSRIGTIVVESESGLFAEDIDAIILAGIPLHEAVLRSKLTKFNKPLFRIVHRERPLLPVDNASGKKLAVWGSPDIFSNVVLPYIRTHNIKIRFTCFIYTGIKQNKRFNDRKTISLTRLLDSRFPCIPRSISKYLPKPIDGILLATDQRSMVMRRLQSLGLEIPVYWCPDIS